MTVTKGLALFVSVTLAGVLVRASGLADSSAAAAPRLTAISSRVNSRGASLLIETSVPVPYVATRPDALTVLLDFRNVESEGLANSVAAKAKSPIVAVRIEPGDSLGAPGSRVRISLAQPVGYHVRSERNTIVVDFDKPSAKGAPYVLPPMTRQAAPDAMQALEQGAAAPFDPVDPIRALGLANTPVAPSAAVVTPPAAVAAAAPAPAQTPPTP